ncbi:hypothetical protein GCM10020221_21730 [Streptomyces thioluteus]|uniref:Lanthionine synthetase C-like protein n=1 Tax=Streptomyces thioluteus TaxID=66431 RepID=A0ABN3WRJ2_STRTU
MLYALDEAGAERYEAGERWLLDHTGPLPPGTPLGLYDGVAGVAFVLDRLGHTGRALDLMDTVLRENWLRLTPDLRGGVAGIGLVLDHLAATTGEPHLRQQALAAARSLAERMTAEDAPTGRRAGLMRGATGPALLFLRLYERTGAPELLTLAEAALRSDLDRCVTTETGGLPGRRGLAHTCRTSATAARASAWSSTTSWPWPVTAGTPTPASPPPATASSPRPGPASTPSPACSRDAPGWSCT